ncbi:MAG: glycosyltransferase family 4 protein, partial [Candidatus Dormibacteraceae bacterium]
MTPSAKACIPDATASPAKPFARVLIFTGQFPPDIGGAGRVPQAIATAFPERVAVVAQKPSQRQVSTADLARFDARFPFRIFRISAFADRHVRWWPGKVRGLLIMLYNWFWIRPKAWFELRRLLASYPFDIACFNTIGHCYWLSRWLRQWNPGLKVVVYSHGEEWGNNMNSSDWGRRAFRAIAKADAVVAVSSFTRDCAVTQGIAAERVHVVNNGVDLSRFSPGPAQPHLLDRWNIRGRPTILCLARFDERKGQDALIGAMPAVLERIPEAVLLLVGEGSDGPRLRALIEELHLQDSVVFTGAVSDEEVVAWYRTADIYAMPNRTTSNGDTEGF